MSNDNHVRIATEAQRAHTELADLRKKMGAVAKMLRHTRRSLATNDFGIGQALGMERGAEWIESVLRGDYDAEPCACGAGDCTGYLHTGPECGPVSDECQADHARRLAEDIAKIAALNERKEAAWAEVDGLLKATGSQLRQQSEGYRVHTWTGEPAVPFSALAPDSARELRDAADRMHGDSLDLWGGCIGWPRKTSEPDGHYRMRLVLHAEQLHWERHETWLP